VGHASFTVRLTKAKLYVEQMDCVILSENGIVTTTPTDFQLKEQELNTQTVAHYLQKLQAGKKMGMTDYDFYKIMEALLPLLKEGREFHIADDLAEAQETILGLILELEDNLEENKLLKNDYIWKALDLLLHKKVMSLRYFGIIHDTEAQKRYAMKYYTFLINALSKIIGFIANGISFKEVGPLQKFVAFAFFRFGWVQDQIIRALSKSTDPPISEEKIAEFGASTRVKSPSRSYVYDWETNVFSLIFRDPKFLNMMGQLEKTTQENPKWAALLFDREYEQLFYGLFS
jgi:hypothetical protein